MPHCIIEYASPLKAQVSPQHLLTAVHETVCQSSLFDAVNVRSRIQSFDDFILGAEKNHFIHVRVKLLQGRSDAEKSQLNQQITDAIAALSLTDVSVSCECLDIHTPSYQRLSL